ncbi:hypothetical protein MNB_SUP05-5-885 [hydrothermal vent metagenome]|uniref:Zn-ribbon-containing, possibly RNA-binding protein and truncated derivatives n=1 Tax=hydrothermal vent metagenome TaxID=652676 RepID=A0A1W1CN89_9ZZZZ
MKIENNLSNNLTQLIQEARKINKLNDWLNMRIPELFNENIVLSVIKEKSVTFVVSSSAFSFVINKNKNRILELFKENEVLKNIISFEIKIK